MDASLMKASALRLRFSQSLASRRQRLSQAMVRCDQTISLDGFYTRQDYPELLRRIRFKDPESGKTLVFITNNFSLPADRIFGPNAWAGRRSPSPDRIA